MRRSPAAAWLALAPALLIVTEAGAQRLVVRVEAGDHDRAAGPVSTSLAMSADLARHAVLLFKGDDGETILGQLTTPSLLSEAARKGVAGGRIARELHLIVPAIEAGESVRLTAVAADPPLQGPSFRWSETEKGDLLSLADQPVMLYVRPELDTSSAEAREQTYKPFHHLYAPDGTLVTKGPGGLYTHHRGLFFGYNRVTYGDGKKADVWHCTGDAHQSHEETTSTEAGPVLGRDRVRIDWHGEGGKVFAVETREVTAYATEGGRLFEFASRVEATGGPVTLDGDPQHAGVHFRASNEVADETKGQTYYLRPDGKGKPGETRNWDPKTGEGPTDLDWNAMSFVLGDQRYTVLDMDRPENPKEARYSERDYGRFGSYFEYELTEDRPLEVRYRLWLQEGELSLEQAEALDANFDEPAKVTITE